MSMKKWTSKELKALRKRYKLSQRKLSELSGVTEHYIYLLERGVRTSSNTLSLLLNCVEEKLKRKGDKK